MLWFGGETMARHAMGTAALIGVLALAGCGGSSSGSSGSNAGAASTPAISPQTPKTGCGSFTAAAPEDPDGVLAALPARQRAALAGYPAPVRRSAWANWRPSHAAPYRVAIVWAQLTTPFQVAATDSLRAALKTYKDVGDVSFRTTGQNLDVGQEIGLMNQAIADKPDLIILEPLTAPAFASQIKKAGEAGIPVLLVLDSYDSPYAVNISGNNVLSAADSTSYMARLLGGRGRLLFVHGLAGSSPDVDSETGFKAVLKNCPGLKKAGDVYGQFVSSAAKAETLKYLATHPQKVDGVFQVAGMAPGIMQAFKQTGRPMPVVDDVANSKGSLGYWKQNEGAYQGVGTGLGGETYGAAIADVAARMLQGRGLKTNAVIDRLPLITDANLGEWADPSWTLDTPGIAPGPKGAFAPDEFLAPLFNDPKPADKTQGGAS
jgi:ribose transport system substrate-binding protein